MKSISVVLFVCLFSLQKPLAQITEDFADGDFTSNPLWTGVAANFRVNESHQLQLNSDIAGTSWLSTSFALDANAVTHWEFLVKQSFSPSGANFGRFYLMSDKADLSAPLNGYYLQFGEAGSGDAVELFRQSGTTSVSVCRASPGRISAAFEIRVHVTRALQGHWIVSVDYSGGTTFVAEASGADVSHDYSVYCGVLCTYTITNSTRFYFDDIAVSTVVPPDAFPPKVDSLYAVSSERLRVLFSEAVARESAENVIHYSLSYHGNPASAMLLADQSTVELLFAEPFRNGYEETLSVGEVSDLSGNLLASTDVKFLYFSPAPILFKDIVITEVFPDPTPAIGLPEAEFVEIFNRGGKATDLSGWTLTDGSATALLPSFIMLPDEYLILTFAASAEKFSSSGNALPLSPFPTLNNTGDLLLLKDSQGLTVDSLHYASSWYQDDEKAEGGWSLEMIDPQNICADQANWVASEDVSGGTPGKQNSVLANKPDNLGPALLSGEVIEPRTLELTFDEKLDRNIPAAEKFASDPPLGISAVAFADPTLTSLVLTFSEEVRSGQHYTISAHDVYDCAGNKIREGYTQVKFVLPEKATPGDIVVNEILFDPRPGGIDFVEVYNRSPKTIDLRNWSVRNVDSGSGKKSTLLSAAFSIIGPGDYRVFTEDPDVLKGEYPLGRQETFWQTDLPALNDDEGFVTITDDRGAIIDSAQYMEEMHSPFVLDAAGVSLERISFSSPGHEASNWRSASSAQGYATPGYLNSNFRESSAIRDASVVIEPEIIQPQTNSFANIRYRFDRGGFMANVRIFDQQGRTIRRIAENQLLGAEGFFRWDGDLENGMMARTGYYLVWFEVFDAEGEVKRFRKRIAVY